MTAPTPTPLSARLREALARPVDASSLALFRIAFGLIMLWESWRFYDRGWFEAYYLEPTFRFTYWPFDWVDLLPGAWAWLPFVLWPLAALAVAAGLFYRAAAATLWLTLSWVFLLDQARYLNHFYLVCLLAFLLVFLPTHRVWSLDAWRARRHAPAAAVPTDAANPAVPAWTLWLLRFQIAVPYFFGGVAKIDPDWLRGRPLADWLSDEGDFPILGPYLESGPEAAILLAWAGMFLDLFIVPALLWRRTRLAAIAAALLFHVTNAGLFSIGIFPWMMMCATLMFLPAWWPRRVLADLERGGRAPMLALATGLTLGATLGSHVPSSFSPVHALVGAFAFGVLALELVRQRQGSGQPDEAPALAPLPPPALADTPPRLVLVGLALWCAVQIALPVRHAFIDGAVHWTEEGHLYAWHMKLRDKDARARFRVTDTTTGEVIKVRQRDHLTKRQRRKMRSRPDMIVQFAHHLGEHYKAQGRWPVEVRARVTASLNGRPDQLLIDPDIDLLTVKRPWFGHAPWILHLEPDDDTPPRPGRHHSDDD